MPKESGKPLTLSSVSGDGAGFWEFSTHPTGESRTRTRRARVSRPLCRHRRVAESGRLSPHSLRKMCSHCHRSLLNSRSGDDEYAAQKLPVEDFGSPPS